MDVLLIGYSSIVRKRVIPALMRTPGIGAIHVASSRGTATVDIPPDKRGYVFPEYGTALSELPPCVAYVSLPNHLHGLWVRKALSKGFHAIVDKPAFLSESDLNEALSSARERRLCLAEAVVWPFHHQVSALRAKIERERWSIRAIHGIFSFPPLPESNFRNDPARGGGALADLAAYAITPGRVFYGEPAADVRARLLSRARTTGVDTGFSIDALYSDGRIFQGFYSFTTEYQNSLVILGDQFSAQIAPAFTIGPDVEAAITLRSNNQSLVLEIPACDMFAKFFEAVFSSIDAGDCERWRQTLERDADLYFHLSSILEAK